MDKYKIETDNRRRRRETEDRERLCELLYLVVWFKTLAQKTFVCW